MDIRRRINRNRGLVWINLALILIRPSGKYREILSASRKLVTPFSGFILSDHYLSEEVACRGLAWLNPKSRRLKSGKRIRTRPGDIIYCQVDQLKEFVQDYLPRITNEYVLITGKWELPGLEVSDSIHTILSDTNLLAWFSQNQEFTEYPIYPFPYGINLSTAPKVLLKIKESNGCKEEKVVVPFATIHTHLDGVALMDRQTLSPYMENLKPLDEYLSDLSESKWVVSPAGDRSDTYRHWEIIALGSIPISKISSSFKELFGSSILLVNDFDFLVSGEIPENRCVSNSTLATLGYWRERVQSIASRFTSQK